MTEPIISTPEMRELERSEFTDWKDYIVTKAKHRPSKGRVELDFKDEGDGLLGSYGSYPRWGVKHRLKAGDRIRIYGTFGQTIRGIAYWEDGLLKPAWFQTKAEADAERAAWSTRYHERLARENAESFEKPLPDDLPLPLRRRVERFREQHAENPDDGYHEPYEMAPIMEAYRLLKRVHDPAFGKALKDRGILAPTEGAIRLRSYERTKEDGRLDWPDTPEWRLIAFDAINSKMNDYQYKLMDELMPEMDKGHSGNTWSGAIMLTRAIIIDGDKADV